MHLVPYISILNVLGLHWPSLPSMAVVEQVSAIHSTAFCPHPSQKWDKKQEIL